jgi:cellulase
MSKLIQLGALLAALSSIVSGHTYVEFFEMGGGKWPGYRQPSSEKNSPVDPGNDSPAWWTDQGEGYQPVYGDKLNHPVS